MSLITQCPACATMFKVVPDQLRISDGWVRCGQCDEVFDANANLYADPEPQSEPIVQEASEASEAREDWTSSLSFANERHLSKLPAEDVAFKIKEAVEVDIPDRPDEITSEEVVQQEVSTARMQEPELDDLLDLRPGHAREAHGIPDEVSPKVVKPAQSVEPRFAQVQVKTVEHADSPKLTFMRQSRVDSAWQSTGVRVLLSLLALVLVAGFALQVVVHERDRIAATNPAAKGALLVLCDWLGCKVQSLRQIESVVIDGSSFTKVRADVYRLNFTLKSTAAISLAVPALELTLTDLQDQAVVRRVLLPSELGAAKEVLDAGAELTAVLPFAVKSGSANERISGYRLLAFYP
ncbi:MAG: DUF3426 domain-containing protein [Curvibacter sp.]|nr:MAG: DUF3426 domain-containing protein [Curvibacter sp.]